MSALEIFVDEPDDMDQYLRPIAELTEQVGVVTDWRQMNVSLFSALQVERNVMFLILTLIILVAAFNIVGTVTMVVTAKTREIGILRAMGLSAKSVYKIFVIQGIIVGLVGTVTGAIAGIAIAQLFDRGRLIELDPSVYFIDHLPIKVQLFDSMLIIFASIAVATVATLYPSRRAAELAPVDAIRHE